MLDKKDIMKLTDKWCNEVAFNKNPKAIYHLFCEDGNLIGTVSVTKKLIFLYNIKFDVFFKLLTFLKGLERVRILSL